jgi:hypothetical protein
MLIHREIINEKKITNAEKIIVEFTSRLFFFLKCRVPYIKKRATAGDTKLKESIKNKVAIFTGIHRSPA